MKELKARVQDAGQRRILYRSIEARLPSCTNCHPPFGDGGSTPSGQQESAAALVKQAQPHADQEDLKRPSVSCFLSVLLLKPQSSLMVVSFICVPSSMKTMTPTLIGKSYDMLAATDQFHCRAWVTVWYPFSMSDFIRSMLRQFHANSAGQADQGASATVVNVQQESIETMDAQQLVRLLAQNIGQKRYLLVIENINTREVWDSIKLYLRPDIKNASRIIITSQRSDVAQYCAGGHKSSSIKISSNNGPPLSAFCNMLDHVEDQPSEVISRTKNLENIASTSSHIEGLKNTLGPSVQFPKTQPQFVGRQKEMEWLMGKILHRGSGHEVISICGLRGMGKTALVLNAYCDYLADNSFTFTHRAWVAVSNPPKEDELLLYHVLCSFKGSYYLRPLQEMRKELLEFFEQNSRHNCFFRCLIVVDGLNTTRDWDLIKSFLFLERHRAVIQIIVTTRERSIANYCSPMPSSLCNLISLSEYDAHQLFLLKVFGDVSAPLEPDMAQQAKCILEKCGGMPFAIVEVGRHLASRPRTAREWQSFNVHLNLDHLEADHNLGHIREVLESSYNSLPYHFKYCFLYLSIFEEDMNITRRRLVKRWIAEGYMKGIRGLQDEEVGERVFSEFLSKTIIQPTKYASITSGRVNSCSVHRLMLEFSTSKAMEGKLVCMLDNTNSAMASGDTIRHLVVRSSWVRDHEEYKSMNLSRVRSLTIFGHWRPFLLSHDLRMLRILDLEGVTDLCTGQDLKHIGKFRHLKYLGLRNTGIECVPKSVGKLQGLETLDIRYTNVRTLPSTISRLKRLQVLHGGRLNAVVTHSLDVPNGIGELRVLKTLGTISIRKHDPLVIEQLKKLTKLQRLGVTGISDQNGRHLCSVLGHLGSLQSLALKSEDQSGLSMMLEADADSLKSSLRSLQVLKLYGHLSTLPNWISGLRNLFKLYLHNTRLGERFLDVLVDLPNLTTLLLLANSMLATHLTFQQEGFGELKLLELSNLANLTSLSFTAGAMPMLQTFQVGGCDQLEKLSFEVGASRYLQTLQINGCNSLVGDALSGVLELQCLGVHSAVSVRSRLEKRTTRA